MNKLKFIILTLITAVSILFLVSTAQADATAPTGLNAVNFGGPIRLTWTTATGVGTITYAVYRSTDVIADNPAEATYGTYQTVAFGIPAAATLSYIDTTVTDATAYYYFVTATDSNGESNTGSNVRSATSAYPLAGTAYSLSLTATETLINYETSTLTNPSTGTIITYQIQNMDQQGNRWVANQILYDIKYNNETSIYKETQVITSGSGITQGQITWDGRWFNTNQYTKHNGSYTVEMWTKDFAGNEGPKSYQTITVHVVHVNDVVLTYTDYGSDTVAHAGPYRISYQLTQPAFTTIRIYNSNGTVDNSDDTLVRTIIHEVPRDGETIDWNFRCTDFWDLKDDNGNKVAHAKYRFQIDAYQNHAAALSTRDSADSAGWEFAYDFRIVDISSIGITENNALAKLKYTITDDANVKIIICKAGTTFTVDANGEPVPNPSSNLEKTFNFYRNAGSQEESWDGNSENGAVLSNGLYIFAISAKDMNGNHALDANNNDLPIYGNITIDRTGSQISTDSTAPTVTSVSPVNGSIVNASFTEVSTVLQDNTGGSGVDLDNSTITLSNPAGNSITGTQSNNGSDTITLTFTSQDTNGTYTIRITPKDLSGNTGSQATYTFTLNTTAEDIDFKDSVFIYPNPVKGRNATFAYSLTGSATVTIEVYTILGEKVWSKVIYDNGAGDKRVNWRCINNDGEVLADELYIYKILVEYSSGNTRNATKKLIISK